MKKKKLLQVGNYVFNMLSSGKIQVKYLQITTVSGNWEVRYPSYNSQFDIITSFIEDDNFHKYLESYALMLYLMSSELPDLKFMEEFFNSHTDMSNRMLKFHQDNSKEVSDKEDKDILDSEKAKYEMGSKIADLQDKIDETESEEEDEEEQEK